MEEWVKNRKGQNPNKYGKEIIPLKPIIPTFQYSIIPIVSEAN